MHLSTVIHLQPVDGLSNEAFANMAENCIGGESSDGSGSALVSDIVVFSPTPQYQQDGKNNMLLYLFFMFYSMQK